MAAVDLVIFDLDGTLVDTAPDIAGALAAALAEVGVAPPPIYGPNAAVVEASCGQLIYGLRQDERRAPASIAKIVTAMVVAEQAKMTDRVDVKVMYRDKIFSYTADVEPQLIQVPGGEPSPNGEPSPIGIPSDLPPGTPSP